MHEDGPAAPRGSTRRRFLAGAAGTAAAAALGPLATARADERPRPVPLPLRPFGKTGRSVTLFGLGCYPLGALRDEDEAVQVVLRALRAGCTYLDTAPSYADGASERRVGRALELFRRRKTFAGPGPLVATKTHTRTRDAAWRDLEGSLRRLGVDSVDLLQIHAVKDRADLEVALDPKRGPLAALLEAREQKLVRWLGVTGHWDPRVMRSSFERFEFDAVLFPLNCVDPHYVTKGADGARPEALSFVSQTLPAAAKKGLARVAMKVFASGRLTKGGIDPAACLRYTYGLDVSTLVVGCQSLAEVDLAVRVARENQPLGAEEQKALLTRTRPLRGKSTEWYKRA